MSDSNAAFGAALENSGLEKTVTHEVVNHSDGFLNPRGYGTNLLERFWGTFTEWYENPAFRGFKTWRNTYPYCEAFSVYYNFVRPHSSSAARNPAHPRTRRGSSTPEAGARSSSGRETTSTSREQTGASRIRARGLPPQAAPGSRGAGPGGGVKTKTLIRPTNRI
ncbi:MAG: hypothetical protein Q6352_016440 [Candidatus Freyrarchaeum guaymaensis]